MMTPDTRFSVSISLGGERDVGLNGVDELIFRNGLNRINMGLVTKEDIDDLCDHLKRLKLHLPHR